MVTVITDARDAQVVFRADSTQNERDDACEAIVRLVADLEHPAVAHFAIYDDFREAEYEED